MTTALANSARLTLAADPTLGAGNFLRAALAANPARESQILWFERPWRTYLGVEHKGFSLASLQRTADEYAAWYHAQGVKPKDVVGVYMDDGVAFLVHYLALTGLGAIPALINGNMPLPIASAHVRRIGAVGLFTDPSRRPQLEELLQQGAGGEEVLRFLVTDAQIERSGGAGATFPKELPPYYPFTHDPLDPIMIAHSSGTTGVPKPVLLQHKGFFHGIRFRLSQPPQPGPERILSSLPHSHNCAIAYIMLALLNGSPVLILSEHSGRNLLQAASDWRPSMVVSFPQTFVEVTEGALEHYDLSSVKIWMNGGDAAHETHIRALLRAAPGSRFIDGMGSSEMGFSLFRHMHSEGSNKYGRCVGKPHEWVDAAVLGGDGRPLPSGKVGRLGVKAPSVTSGYWNDSVLTHRTRLSGYWLTGDLAWRDDDGWFYHVDRVPDVVKTIHGPLYSLETEELLMSQCPEISDCAVFARKLASGSEEGLALVRLRPGTGRLPAATLLDRYNSVLVRAGKPLLAGIELADQARVPLGATGKVLKRELRDAYAEGVSHGG